MSANPDGAKMSKQKTMSKQEGSVTGLFLCREKGQRPFPVDELIFLAGVGIDGDIHATGGERQVSMLSQETVKWMEEQKQPGLCFKRYKANLRTEGLSLSRLKVGTRLAVGTAVLMVSASPKECFSECILFQKGECCRLSQEGLFLKIEGTGNVRKDDKIVIIA